MFKGRRFPVEILLVCIRWYCKYGISYPAILAEMMQERGVEVAPSTIMLWVHRYAPELEKRVRWYQGYRATCWRVDETYVKSAETGSPCSGCRQAWPADRLSCCRIGETPVRRIVFRGKRLRRCVTGRRPQSRQTSSVLPEGHQPATTRRQAGSLYHASHLQVPQQHHRGRPRRPQAGSSTNAGLSDDEDGRR